MFIEPTHPRGLSCPGEPTDAPPGSEKKIRIMIERASRREPLFHPQDGIPHERAEIAAETPWWHVELSEEVADASETLEGPGESPRMGFVEVTAPEMVAQPA